MGHLSVALDAIASSPLTSHGFSSLSALLPQQLIDQALDETHRATIRKRRLPLEQVVQLIVGMSLLRGLSIEKVVDHLQLALHSEAGPVAKSSIPAARERLGAEPIELLFALTGNDWGHKSADRHRWRDLALYAADGTTISVPDSDANSERFGRKQANAAFPAVRLVTLMATQSRTLVAAEISGIGRSSEYSLAADLWPRIPDRSLTFIDRGLSAANVTWRLSSAGTNRNWLARAKRNQRWKVLEQLGPDDHLVELRLCAATRAKHPDLPLTRVVRAIGYHHKRGEKNYLLTSLVDPESYPRQELIDLYHERWEIELGFDELKTHLNEHEILRSKTPTGVEQELWGLLLAYNLVRVQTEQLAAALGVKPRRVSFLAVLTFIRPQLLLETWAAPGNAAQAFERATVAAKRFLLPPRRTERYFKREVKRWTQYPLARAGSKRGAK